MVAKAMRNSEGECNGSAETHLKAFKGVYKATKHLGGYHRSHEAF